jgi:hypothetical protein
MKLACVLVVLSLYQASQVSKLDWAAAERNIVRLKPAAFPNLPAAVRAYLEKRTCTIPQSPEVDEQPNNVVRGRFTSVAQQDLAVLCSVKGVSTVLVFRGSTASDVAELAAMEDKGFLQTTGPNTIAFSRVIGVAGPAAIRTYYKEFGGTAPLPSRLDHDGINDAFMGKASIVRYWFGGKWLELTGMD